MTEAEQQQKDRQKRDFRDGVEKGYQRVEELACERDFPQRREDRARRRQIARSEAGAAENFPSQQRRDRQKPILDRSRVESHASSSARAFNTSSRTRSQTSTRKARYSRD